MKIVLDTNVLIAALIARGFSHQLLEHCALRHSLFTSDFILEETFSFIRKSRGLKMFTPSSLLQHEQVFVAGDDAIAFTANCSGQDIVVVWIAADGILKLRS